MMEKLERARELTGVSIYVSALVKDQIRMAESAEIPETAKAALNNAASLLDQLIPSPEEIDSSAIHESVGL